MEDREMRVFLQEFQDQPEEVRRIFIYAICQTMVQAGLLRFVGAFNSPGIGLTLMYQNPDTDDAFEIVKPDMSEDDEKAMQAHIGELLQENSQAA